MACRESGGSKILLCLGLFVVASSFCCCTKLTRLKTVKWRENSTLSQSQDIDLHHGRLLIGQDPLRHAKLKGTKATKNYMDVNSGYQADMGWEMSRQPKGQGDGSSKADNSAVERLLKMEPKVECTGDSMKLKVQDAASTSGSLFLVDRGSHLSPLPLSKLPSSCGYTIGSTRRDMVLVAPYDGCFVTLEEDSYVLPLRWCGLPVRMSCPLMRQSSPNPPMVTCHAEGMVVKMEWATSVDKIKVKLYGSWEPLMRESPRCGFSVVVHPEGVVISVRYAPCVEKKDGMYTIELAGDGETKISCPALSPAQPGPTKSPIKGPQQQTEIPGKGVYPSNQSHNLPSTRAPDQTLKNPVQTVVPQVPGIPQNPEVPNQKQNQGPKDVVQPQLPYFYPNFFYPQPANPENRPTVQPNPTPVTKKKESQQTIPAKLPVTPEGQVPQLISLPFYPWPAKPEVPVKETPVLPRATQPPNSQVEQPFYPYPFYVMPNPDVAPAHRTELKPTPTSPPVTQTTQGQRKQPFYPLPFYPQPAKPDNPPTQPPVTKHFLPYPSNPPSGPTQKPVEPPASQSEAPQGQVHQTSYPYPLYPVPVPENQPATKPTTAPEPPKPPQPEDPQGQVHQPLYPYPFYPVPVPENQPATKPTAAPEPPKPPQPEAPQGQVHQTSYPYPFYPVPVPENQPASKPTAAPEPPKPPQPEAPQGQVHQPLYPYPFYPVPVPENQPATKPTAAPEPPKPPQPEAPQGQVHQPLYPYPFYPVPVPENQPATKPAAAPEPPKPPQPEAPQGQVHQTSYPYPFYPVPVPENQPASKPTAAPEPPKPPQPEAPQGQVHQPLYPYPFYPVPVPENQPATKPAAAPEPPKPPQPEAPQGQVHQTSYPYPFYPVPVPENQPASKPTAAPEPPKPPQPEAPQGQVHQPLYPYPFYPVPVPENQPATKPTAAPEPPKPPQPEAPQGQVHQTSYPYPFYPVPEPENQPATKPTAAPEPPKPPQPEAPQGQVHQTSYPYPFYPVPVPENQPATKPTAAPEPPKPPQPEAPQGQVHQTSYPYPFYPVPVPENQPASKPTAAPEPPKPPQPEAPQGQVHQPLYPYPFYPVPVPENQPATKPTAAPEPPKPPQPEAPQGQVHQTSYPYPFYPVPEPENQPATKPTAAPEPPKPPQPEAPQGQVHQPSYPYPFYPVPVPENQPATKPTAAPEPPKPPQPEVPQGQVHQPLYPYPFYPVPVPENQLASKPTSFTESPATETPKGQPVTLPPTSSAQQPQWITPASDQKTPESTIQQPSNVIVPQGPQPGTPNMPPVYCPQVCPSGFSNCCPQIAFHQHLHHIVPAGLGSKDTPPIYTGLPFLSPMSYYVFGNGLSSAPLPQKPNGETQIEAEITSAPISPQSLPSENRKQPHLQPPDGNPAALPGSNPTKPTHPALPIYPYFVPNSDWRYLPQNGDWQNLPQSQSQTLSNVPSTPQTSVNDPVNPVVQYELYNVQPPKQQNGQLSSYVAQYLQRQYTKNQNKPTVKEVQPSNKKPSESKSPAHHKAQSELDPRLFPYYMLQDAQAPTHNKSLFPNNSLQPPPSVSGSKNSSKHEQTVHSYSEPKSYVLLQHGPPGREPNGFAKSPQPFRDLVRDTNVLAQNFATHHNSEAQHPQGLSLQQGKPQNLKWLDKGMTNPLPGNVNYMPRPGDRSGLPFFTALDGVHSVPLPQDLSFSATQKKPKFLDSFKDSWKPIAPLGSSRRTPPHVPRKAFQQWSSAADHQG
ncbi:titin-like isoform X2 [Thunnus maccoyii]|uniref:titin-like isoform X2 n=1 Tax=Thunnus maccoyii TaxID=8240 RepID=UPI001C4CFCCA|nr:titin-like isoform X2 [Thunnus maccoyii]